MFPLVKKDEASEYGDKNPEGLKDGDDVQRVEELQSSVQRSNLYQNAGQHHEQNEPRHRMCEYAGSRESTVAAVVM